MPSIRIIVAYDGTDYCGWQEQRRDGVVQADQPTVQGVLRQTMQQVLGHPVRLSGASRTDSGVHAWGQAAQFQTDSPIPVGQFPHALNSRLPSNIVIRSARVVDDGSDVGRSTLSKLYRYQVHQQSSPPRDGGRFCWHWWQPSDLIAMQRAAQYLIGEHDFISFAAHADQRYTTVRTIYRCELFKMADILCIDVEGSGFLYHMVRNIVGTLMDIGRDRWQPQYISEIIAARDRTVAGPTAPARGLCLRWVKY